MMPVSLLARLGAPAVVLAALGGCAPEYSPNVYASNAVQQANKVEPAIVVGFRQVKISASGTVGVVSGGAAGGILGAQTDVSGVNSALGALGGTIVGGVVGSTFEHTTGDTTGWEYIVRKPNGEMLSVTQRERTPIPLGQKVLVIAGNQARIVPDYSVTVDPPTTPEKEKVGTDDTPSAAPAPVAATPAQPLPPTEASKPSPMSAVEPPPVAREPAQPGSAPASAGDNEDAPSTLRP
jgi:outer membrane lipoprotein SlyB